MLQCLPETNINKPAFVAHHVTLVKKGGEQGVNLISEPMHNDARTDQSTSQEDRACQKQNLDRGSEARCKQINGRYEAALPAPKYARWVDAYKADRSRKLRTGR
jgi:hypothetical protein